MSPAPAPNFLFGPSATIAPDFPQQLSQQHVAENFMAMGQGSQNFEMDAEEDQAIQELNIRKGATKGCRVHPYQEAEEPELAENSIEICPYGTGR